MPSPRTTVNASNRNDFLWPLLIVKARALQTLPPGLHCYRLFFGVCALVLFGCQSPNLPSSSPITPAASPAPAAVAATPSVAAGATFTNPVLRANFADPGVLLVGDTYYVYATNAIGKNVQVARSQDLVRWQQLPDALPALPGWARPGGSLVWAPEVIQIGNQFVLYYTARDKASNRQCIGVAIADAPAGRFIDLNSAPLVCQADEGGSIDASPFRDGDQLYLYWKNDGNCCAKPTYLYAQPLTADGLSLTGEATRLVRNDALWEGTLIEAPTMVRHATGYYLFFSANDYGGPKYAVGYARCETATGPCADAPENPILQSRMDQKPLIVGPGHQAVVEVDGEYWMFYHAWEIAGNGMRGDRRLLYIDRLVWQDGLPRVIGPTTDVEPVP